MDQYLEILTLLQLASPSLPVGAYSYSEGLEYLVESNVISNIDSLEQWLNQELNYGSIRLETGVMWRAYDNFEQSNVEKIIFWNQWLSAARETQELRQQSWQMGQSLLKLIVNLDPSLDAIAHQLSLPCNYAIVFGIATAHWQIPAQTAILAYLHSWLTNLINAGVKLIPLGQTAGQQLLFKLRPLLITTTEQIINLPDEKLSNCGWGLALASMAHETQYTRLFRS